MKLILTFIACFLLSGSSFFFGCRRPEILPSAPPTSPSLKTIKAKVVEYGTDQPLKGATVSLCAATPQMNNLSDITNDNGECFFTAAHFGCLSVEQEGYWNLDPGAGLIAPVFLYPGNLPFSYYSNPAYPCDSFVAKLFPQSFITIHIKDSSGAGNGNEAYLYCYGLFSLPDKQYSVFGNNAISLRPLIDTSFSYPVFGNTDNEFFVWVPGQDDQGYSVFEQIRYIANRSNIVLNITY